MAYNMRSAAAALLYAPAVLWMGVIFYGSSIPGSRISSPFSPVAHFVEYAVLAALLSIWPALSDRPFRTAVVAATLLAVAYGVSDEIHQAFVPGRMPSIADLLVDTAGALTGAVTATLLIKKAARRRPSDTP